jgi:hypothetical protein
MLEFQSEMALHEKVPRLLQKSSWKTLRRVYYIQDRLIVEPAQNHQHSTIAKKLIIIRKFRSLSIEKRVGVSFSLSAPGALKFGNPAALILQRNILSPSLQ